jgi:pimeloyl-ACP methyl ester carboxylesterase
LAQAGYRVAAPDMRGYGRRSKPHAVHDYRITELVEVLVGLVHARGETQAIVVGHDWGSPIAWTAAWTRPDVSRAVAGISVAFGDRGTARLLRRAELAASRFTLHASRFTLHASRFTLHAASTSAGSDRHR